ncbi:AraC family transcriptional regulator [Thaumasiovibrio subtropicus]|uniref:AraC family transcriptional regulator n=1 Tax=Thaumasiovibrio subtropicus TaxID=1891207 RepID=UPI000B35B8E0|nr:AraC family transcriptional regulator [Thaumasiovibrio subtropicus]
MKQDPTASLMLCPSLPFVEMRQANQSAACYHAHSHDEFSFGVIDHGSATYQNLKRRHAIQIRDTVTINPGDVHACNPNTGKWSYRMLFVDTQWLSRRQQEWREEIKHYRGTSAEDWHPFRAPFERDLPCYDRFHHLYGALQQEPNPLVTETLLITTMQPYFCPPEQLGLQPKPRRKLERVREQMLDQIHLNLSLEALSDEAGMSRYGLIKAFNQQYGVSPHAMQLDERIKRAKQLLKSGLSLTDTAANLGFSDQAHFQRHFKKRLAITPKQYQIAFYTQ